MASSTVRTAVVSLALQINPNFGTAIGIGSPARPPRVIQMSARFSF